MWKRSLSKVIIFDSKYKIYKAMLASEHTRFKSNRKQHPFVVFVQQALIKKTFTYFEYK